MRSKYEGKREEGRKGARTRILCVTELASYWIKHKQSLNRTGFPTVHKALETGGPGGGKEREFIHQNADSHPRLTLRTITVSTCSNFVFMGTKTILAYASVRAGKSRVGNKAYHEGQVVKICLAFPSAVCCLSHWLD